MSLIQLDQAIEILLKNTKEIKETENISLLEAESFILAEDIYAKISNPPFDRSPLDGYTFNHLLSKGASLDSPIELDVLDEISAGSDKSILSPTSGAIQIMTGGPIPKGCDCVIRQEDVEYDKNNNTIKIFKETKKNENFCFMGEDYMTGDLLIEAGSKLTPNHIGLIASLGITNVKAFKKPAIGFISTGNELISPGSPLTFGKIYNSNQYFLSAKLKSLGCKIINFPILEDNPKVVAQSIEESYTKVDLFITTGGVSVGKYDIMHDVIKILNCEKLFWRVDIQPGTPVLASLYKEKIILSLSGNPFAALVNFEVLGKYVLSKLSKNLIPSPVRKKGLISEGFFPKLSKRRRFIRAIFRDGNVILSDTKHSSGQISSTLNKNALIDVPKGTRRLDKGDNVEVIIIE